MLQIRDRHMGQWQVNTRKYISLDAAINYAETLLQQTQMIYIWPLGETLWLVISQIHGLPN